MRSCGRRGDSHTVAQLANMFHNLPGVLCDATTPADFDRILDEMWRLCPDGTARDWLHQRLARYGVDPERYAPLPPQIMVPWPSNKRACPLCQGSAVRAARVMGTFEEFFVCPACDSVWLSRTDIGYETAVYLAD